MIQLQATKLTYCYQHHEVFSNLNFSLHEGECLIVQGNNGSGKTTLLKILAGLKRHYQGMVRYGSNHVSIDDFLSDILFLSHQNGTCSYMSVNKAIETFTILAGRKNDEERNSYLEKFSLSPYLNNRIHELSAGQQRKVALMRLVVIPAKIWLLDEPFANLDKNTQSIVVELIERHCCSGGSVMVSTHHESDILRHQLSTTVNTLNLSDQYVV